MSGRRKSLVRLGLLSVPLAFALYGAAHDRLWPVPDEFRKMKNPVPKSEATLKAAAAIYADTCSKCHGDTGMGDGPEADMYDPVPASFADAKMMGMMTDGELFYKMTEGRKPMPSFKKKLTDEERWQLVHYIREFARKPDPKTPAKTPPRKH